jgi:hypothetical protein
VGNKKPEIHGVLVTGHLQICWVYLGVVGVLEIFPGFSAPAGPQGFFQGSQAMFGEVGSVPEAGNRNWNHMAIKTYSKIIELYELYIHNYQLFWALYGNPKSQNDRSKTSPP